MILSGIADEAGTAIADQVRAHRELGFDHIELRLVDGQQFTQLDDAAFDAVLAAVEAAGLQVSCYGSAIANWARPISGDFSQDLADLERSIPRMQRTGTRVIRVMSWPNDGWSQDAWRDEALRRMRELARRAEDGGVVLGIENCDGYAAQDGETMMAFIDAVGSPAVQVLFDTGNAPCHGQDSLAWYRAVRPRIAYVHIKDSVREGDARPRFTRPGHGDGRVREILADLAATGYDGCIAIEPHLQAVVHTGEDTADAVAKYRAYVDYGRELADMVAAARERAGHPVEG